MTAPATLTGTNDNDTVTRSATQWAGFSTIDLAGGIDVLNVEASGDISVLATPGVSNVETGNLTGTVSDDSITLTGAQLDAIIIGGGTINLGAGTDTVNLTSTSADLNTLGATDASIQSVEAISAATAGAEVTITLSGQTEGFTITGSSSADSITTGSGNDTIVGAQNDTLLNGGDGTDTLQVGANLTSTSDGQIANIENATLTSAVTFNLVNQTEGFTITGSSSADSITTGSGNDTIVGAQNDTLLNGGGGTDTLQVGANFTSSSNTQIVNIENVAPTSAVTLNLANQNEGFTITGSSSADSITTGSGNDTIVGAQNDTLLNGGGGTDTLQVGASFTSTSNTQIVNIENVALTSAVTLNLANQTEGFTITGSSSADSITTGSGNDTIVGAENDTLLDGGGGTDTLQVGANFTSTSDAQIVNIENVTLTSAVTLNLVQPDRGLHDHRLVRR